MKCQARNRGSVAEREVSLPILIRVPNTVGSNPHIQLSSLVAARKLLCHRISFSVFVSASSLLFSDQNRGDKSVLVPCDHLHSDVRA